MKSSLTKKRQISLLVFIIVIAAFLRLYQLGQNPHGFFIDEASNGYNAYSILKTAKDEYGNFMPLTFRAFGDYNPALSVYTLVPSIAIFGLNEFAVRFPSALLGTLAVFFSYLLTKKLFEKNISLLTAFFLAISPWHIQFSRFDHEANFMLTFILIALTFFLSSFKKPALLIPASVFFGLALNSYHGAKILVPLVLLSVFFVYRDEILKFKSKLKIPALVIFLSTLPFLLNFQNSLIRGQSVGILQEQHPITTFLSNYLSHFSPNFLFIQGDTIGRHSVSGIGELYVFQIPLIILGLLFLFKLKSKAKNLLVALLLVSAIPPALANPAPHALRGILFAPVWAIVCALGVVSFLNLKKKMYLKLAVVVLTLAIATYNIITYLHLYYIHYPKQNAMDWQDGYAEMVKYVHENESKYEKVIISNFFAKSYIFVLFYSKYDPAKYHNQSADKNAFDKYEFFGDNWEKKTTGPVLIVRPFWQKPIPPPLYLKEVYDASNTLIFRISQE